MSQSVTSHVEHVKDNYTQYIPFRMNPCIYGHIKYKGCRNGN